MLSLFEEFNKYTIKDNKKYIYVLEFTVLLFRLPIYFAYRYCVFFRF